jgi:hypothetical protein
MLLCFRFRGSVPTRLPQADSSVLGDGSGSVSQMTSSSSRPKSVELFFPSPFSLLLLSSLAVAVVEHRKRKTPK